MEASMEWSVTGFENPGDRKVRGSIPQASAMPYREKNEQRKYQREWRANRRAEWINKNGPCARCGSWITLEVDHVDATKKVDHKIWTWSLQRRLKELAKCQVLCKKCHTKKAMEAGERPTTVHGASGMYQLHGCRCALCRTWKRESDKRYRRRVN